MRTHRAITFTEKCRPALVQEVPTPMTVVTITDVRETAVLTPVAMIVVIIITVVDTIVRVVQQRLVIPLRVEAGVVIAKVVIQV